MSQSIHTKTKFSLIYLSIFLFGIISSTIYNHKVEAQEPEFSEPMSLSYVFSVNMNSTKESQHFPFRNKLIYNYSPNPDLRFIEGKTFTDEQLHEFISTIIESSKLNKMNTREWFTISKQIWLNTPAEKVMNEAKEAGIDTLYFIDLQSIALVEVINQQKTLFMYDRDKPDKTTAFDYFYNIRGRIALIKVQYNKIVYQKTLAGIDFLSPREPNTEKKELMLSKTARELGDRLYFVLKNQHKYITDWTPPPEE